MSVGLLAANREWAQVPDGYASLVEQLLRAPGVDPDRSALVDEAGAVWSRPGFDTILSQSRLGFTPFDYQLATMQTVLRRMRGRAILADEVGLGKTIEAGLVLSELRMRGLADRALVITPAGLVDQWREELERKFGLPTTIAARGGWEDGEDRPVVLASLAAARRDPLRSALAGPAVGHGDRRRGAPAAQPHQRVGQTRPGSADPLPAAAHRHPGGEPAAGPLRAGQPRRPGPAGHDRAVPPHPRHGRHRGGRAAQRRHRCASAPARSWCATGAARSRCCSPSAWPRPCWSPRAQTSRRRSTPTSPRGSGRRPATPPRAGAWRCAASPGSPGPARLPRHPRSTRSAGPIWPSGPGRSGGPASSTSCSPGCAPTSGAGRRCWCSPRSGTPSTRWSPRSPRRASRRPPTTAACRAGRRTPRWPPSPATCPCCCPPSPRARAATCSSAT